MPRLVLAELTHPSAAETLRRRVVTRDGERCRIKFDGQRCPHVGEHALKLDLGDLLAPAAWRAVCSTHLDTLGDQPHVIAAIAPATPQPRPRPPRSPARPPDLHPGLRA